VRLRCKMALSLAMMALIEPGAKYFFPIGFPIYRRLPAGWRDGGSFWTGREKHVPPDVEEIARKITPLTTMLIFNSPNNPTGRHSTMRFWRNSRARHQARSMGNCGRDLRAHTFQGGV